ncbi:MAG: AAA family ATPase [Breoghania sp.]|nr:AAA family ATPase [Breoghania sp.]MDJ0930110.1 AAA family ATPase [Breoghania sp.]
MTREVYVRLCEKAEVALAAGASIVVDAVFAAPEERSQIAAIARKLEVRSRAFWLEADFATMSGRVEQRANDASDADVAVLRRQLVYDLGEISWTRIDASGTREETRARVEAALASA